MQEKTLKREYYDNKLTRREIAEKYGICEQTVSRYMRMYNIRLLEHYERLDLPDLTPDQHAFIVGTMLGDGYMEITHTSENARMYFEHSTAQREYVEWKYNMMKPYVKVPMRERSRMRLGKELHSCLFRTVSHPVFTDYHRMIYHSGVKVVTNELADLIEPLSLATWVMDDGAKAGNAMVLCSESFTPPEQERLCAVIKKKYGLIALLQNNGKRKGNNQSIYRIFIPKRSMTDFLSIIGPHVIDCMRYKVAYNVVDSGTSEAIREAPAKLGEDMVQPSQ